MRSPVMALALYDPDAPKKPTNLSVNQDLLRVARSRKLNLSRILEERLVEVLRDKERETWLQENALAIKKYNERVERDGVFSDGLRRF